MVVDHKYDGFSGAKLYLNSLVSPLQYLANLPGDALNWGSQRLTSHQRLLELNEDLTNQASRMNAELLELTMLRRENDKLRRLLGSPVRQGSTKMVAELMAVDNNPYSHQIVINKGSLHGVYEGQPVLDDKGIVGQIVQISPTNSRVLMITDVTHGIPLRVARNDIRLTATGSGSLSELAVQHVPRSTDIEVGDLLLSSGLGGVFPEGYPTAKITHIDQNEGRKFIKVAATPMAQLDRLKYLLLLWPENAPNQPDESESEP